MGNSLCIVSQRSGSDKPGIGGGPSEYATARVSPIPTLRRRRRSAPGGGGTSSASAYNAARRPRVTGSGSDCDDDDAQAAAAAAGLGPPPLLDIAVAAVAAAAAALDVAALPSELAQRVADHLIDEGVHGWFVVLYTV
jgi:hypothetical protein